MPTESYRVRTFLTAATRLEIDVAVISEHRQTMAEALAVDGVVGLEITIPINEPVVPLPEGNRYLGFIFARGRNVG